MVDAGVEFRALLAEGVDRVANVEETCAVGGAEGGVVVGTYSSVVASAGLFPRADRGWLAGHERLRLAGGGCEGSFADELGACT